MVEKKEESKGLRPPAKDSQIKCKLKELDEKLLEQWATSKGKCSHNTATTRDESQYTIIIVKVVKHCFMKLLRSILF